MSYCVALTGLALAMQTKLASDFLRSSCWVLGLKMSQCSQPNLCDALIWTHFLGSAEIVIWKLGSQKSPPMCNSSFLLLTLQYELSKCVCVARFEGSYQEKAVKLLGNMLCTHLQEQKSRDGAGLPGNYWKGLTAPLPRIRTQEYWGCRDHWLPTQDHGDLSASHVSSAVIPPSVPLHFLVCIL